MAWDITELGELLTLEPHGPDTYVGISATYPWGRVYGGQVVAQALAAAAATVDGAYAPHSLHSYFIRSGDSDETIRFEVDRIRNGRSFVTRRVVARQSGGAILNLSASFHVHEDEPDVVTHTIAEDVPPPQRLDDDEVWSPVLRRRSATDLEAGRAAAWLRTAHGLDDDAVSHACALAYLSDDMPTETAHHVHPDWSDDLSLDERRGRFMGASLDHTIWFHRAGRSDEWQLHDFRCHGLSGARGLSVGQVHGTDGVHVATVVQQMLLRRARV